MASRGPFPAVRLARLGRPHDAPILVAHGKTHEPADRKPGEHQHEEGSHSLPLRHAQVEYIKVGTTTTGTGPAQSTR